MRFPYSTAPVYSNVTAALFIHDVVYIISPCLFKHNFKWGPHLSVLIHSCDSVYLCVVGIILLYLYTVRGVDKDR